MFNLEKSIADWRQQMLAAGIKTPVPLQELEIHLRDEIEQHKNLGMIHHRGQPLARVGEAVAGAIIPRLHAGQQFYGKSSLNFSSLRTYEFIAAENVPITAAEAGSKSGPVAAGSPSRPVSRAS